MFISVTDFAKNPNDRRFRFNSYDFRNANNTLKKTVTTITSEMNSMKISISNDITKIKSEILEVAGDKADKLIQDITSLEKNLSNDISGNVKKLNDILNNQIGNIQNTIGNVQKELISVRDNLLGDSTKIKMAALRDELLGDKTTEKLGAVLDTIMTKFALNWDDKMYSRITRIINETK